VEQAQHRRLYILVFHLLKTCRLSYRSDRAMVNIAYNQGMNSILLKRINGYCEMMGML
jgi:hypothetical protein